MPVPGVLSRKTPGTTDSAAGKFFCSNDKEFYNTTTTSTSASVWKLVHPVPKYQAGTRAETGVNRYKKTTATRSHNRVAAEIKPARQGGFISCHHIKYPTGGAPPVDGDG